MRFDYGCGEREAKVSALTLVIYEQEFGGADLVKDFYGKVVYRKEKAGETVLDYTRTNWTVALKVLWAALKTADDGLPSFRAWVAGVGDINLIDLSAAVRKECEAHLFRASDTAAG